MTPLNPQQAATAALLAKLAPVQVLAAANGHVAPRIGLLDDKAVIFKSIVHAEDKNGDRDDERVDAAITNLIEDVAEVGFDQFAIINRTPLPTGAAISIIFRSGRVA